MIFNKKFSFNLNKFGTFGLKKGLIFLAHETIALTNEVNIFL